MKKQPKFLFFICSLAFVSSVFTSDSWSDQGLEKAPVIDAKSAIPIEKAQQLAEVHLSLRNVRWGNPTEKTQEGNRWVFGYETPVAEQRVLGPRRVSVDKTSGLVRVRDR